LHIESPSVYKRAHANHDEGKEFLMRIAAIFGLFAVLLLCSAALADVIELTNGDKIEGKILEETETGVRIQTSYGPLVIPRNQIKNITKGDAEPEKAEPEKAEPEKAEPAQKGETVDVIELKNGDKIKGRILAETDAAVKIQTAYGPLNIPRSQIAKVNKGVAEAPKPSGELLAKNKELADKHYELAMWAKENGLEKQMQENLEAAIEIYPDHEKARAALGYEKKDGTWVKSGKAVEPGKPGKMTAEELGEAHGIAQSHLNAKEYDQAIAIYEKILESYPDDLTANYNTACIYSLKKRIEKALNYLETAVRKSLEAKDSGSYAKQQEAQQILGLLDNDTDLDSLRETKRFKEIMRLAKGEKEEARKEPQEDPAKEPKEEPEKEPVKKEPEKKAPEKQEPEKKEPEKPGKKQRDF
jgi:tetratricopeptide (TPR) repeat protein